MSYIYIILTRSNTVYSRLIHAVTGDKYTHVSLGLGDGASELYSFSRKRAHLPLPSPIVREDVPGLPCPPPGHPLRALPAARGRIGQRECAPACGDNVRAA